MNIMKVAVITHAFHPSNHANGKRPSYLVNALLEQGWSVDVYTSALGCERGVSESMGHPNLTIRREIDLVVSGVEKLKFFRTLHRIVVSMLAGLMWPDFYVLWSRRIIKLLSSAKPYDSVICFVFPPSLYLAAKKKSLINERWIFDLQESVTPQYLINPRRSPLQRVLQPKLRKFEKLALEQAGGVVYTAQTNREAYINQGLVTEGKTIHIPYFYDSAVFGGKKSEIPDLLEIRYFGTFDWSGNRSPKTFLTSLAGFLQKNPEARNMTQFTFYGNWLSEHDEIIKELNIEDVVKIHSAVSYQKYLELVSEAPVLLLVLSSEHNLFMPSKIVDYFGGSRPILAYVPRESEMRTVLQEAGMSEQTINESDVTGGIEVIESLWQKFSAKQLNSLDAKTEQWSSEVQLPRYIKLLKGLSNSSSLSSDD